MKAHLMFRDQDFDPLAPLPIHSPDLIHDLELEVLFNAMARGDKFLYEISKAAVLSSLKDVDSVLYRQEILRDCLEHSSVIREIYQILIEAIERKRRSWLGIFTHYPSGVLSGAVDIISMFIPSLEQLRKIADKHMGMFHSEGLTRFFAMLQSELSDEYLSMVKYHLQQLKFPRGVLISAELGMGNEGMNYTLRLPNTKNKNWIKEALSKKSPTFSFTISERDEAGARVLGALRDVGVSSCANALAQAAEHIESFFNMLRTELAFYLGCINLKEQLEQIGNPIAFPVPAVMAERKHNFKGLYDVSLALTMKREVVGNDINADSKDLIMITGANQGGKSTFLRSIGLAQLMMQAGMFVPAQEFCANLCSGVFTHYRRKEDALMKSGKLDEELSRMSAIVDRIKPNALMLFNESFASTNEREGSEIARQITSALLDRRIKVFFVTHLYEFARVFYEKQMENALFLRAERSRTFRLLLGGPLATSFGEDVFKSVFGKQRDQVSIS
ncbi:DNA mismatch repair protein MutS [Thermanaerothrix daxensis]|uniref:DNA mismatch repair protein MutS n=1 Tax=Thermanaerothrix daxensis TaxID=869279 RepID=A0A0N8GQT4_9CHLR|nr:DNA mismatch repair protein MutS [Thermanaerothrix daxensis]KPL84586.1 DNA mismatch repair protein MutS [Thermanaerothrix daxensis]